MNGNSRYRVKVEMYVPGTNKEFTPQVKYDILAEDIGEALDKAALVWNSDEYGEKTEWTGVTRL